MALIVEDGTGVATANSYNSTAELDAWLVARPHAEDWLDRSTAQKEAAAQAAFTVLNRLQWDARRTTLTQAGAWPRDGVSNAYGDGPLATNVIPAPVKLAHALLSRWLAQKDRFEAQEQGAVTSSSSSGRSRTVGGGARNLAVVPGEVLDAVAIWVDLTTAPLVRAA